MLHTYMLIESVDSHVFVCRGMPGVHELVWTLNFLSFYFLYPSTFNILEVRVSCYHVAQASSPSARRFLMSTILTIPGFFTRDVHDISWHCVLSVNYREMLVLILSSFLNSFYLHLFLRLGGPIN